MLWYATVYFNTDENNAPVPEEVPFDEMPKCIYGPFDNEEAAKKWVEDCFPDDKDVHEVEYGPAAEYPGVDRQFVNDPKKVWWNQE